MSRVAELIGALARHELAGRTFCELAVVESAFSGDDGPDAQTANVTLKDQGLPLPRVPIATGVTGFAGLPRAGDVVLVAFPRGDLASAVVVAQVYGDRRRPPSAGPDDLALVWPGDAGDAEAEAVQALVRADGNAREVRVALGGGKDARVSITDGVVHLVAGGAEVRVQHASDSDGVVELSAGDARVRLDQRQGDVVVETTGKLTLRGREILLEGDVGVTINGQQVKIN